MSNQGKTETGGRRGGAGILAALALAGLLLGNASGQAPTQARSLATAQTSGARA